MITAKKPVKFDRSYAIGEEVPLEVIDPAAKKRLIDMGLIEDSPGYYMDYDPIHSVRRKRSLWNLSVWRLKPRRLSSHTL